MSGVSCNKCGRDIAPGESVWASDWKVIDTSGGRAVTRAVLRYTCGECFEGER